MGRTYRIDKARDFRKVRLEIVVFFSLIIIVFLGLLYVAYDLGKNKVTVDDSGNYATLGVVESSKRPFSRVDTELYSMKIPADWKRVNDPEIIINGTRYYPERFQGTTGDDIGRRLDIYHKSIPSDLGVDKVIAVTGMGKRIGVGDMSEQCYKFTERPDERYGDDYPSVWKEKDIEFMCKTSKLTNIIGAIEHKQSDGVTLDSSHGPISFLLVYTDHGSSQDNDIFREILESFEAK